jgi:endogenous inhibitor of DNA gyrase (YacG/DUF329 family)
VTAPAPSKRTVACPSCGEPAVFAASNRWRPFCSERCRITDLGAWASESYRIPAKPGEDEIAGGAEESDP